MKPSFRRGSIPSEGSRYSFGIKAGRPTWLLLRGLTALLAASLVCLGGSPGLAVEGPTIAGPIGGTDIRSAQLPPPGLYGGLILLGATAFDFVGGNGKTIPALSEAHLTKYLAGSFLYYVPHIKVFNGSIGFGGIIPGGEQCGHLFVATPDECNVGVGDPYVELDWSRFFGTVRPSSFSGAVPIHEGLTTLVGFGVVFPGGQYDASDLTTQALSIGTNVYDFAPTVAVTYTTRPLLAEGTELSAKAYLNNYLTNPDTDYSSGSLVNVDFAVSEHMGRFQFGLAGLYVIQLADDKQFGVPIQPDGRRVKGLQLGGVLNYDMPKREASLKVKELTSVTAKNSVRSYGVVVDWIKKF